MRPVDVLAVMNDAADALSDNQRYNQSADVRGARAAVAELVEASFKVCLCRPNSRPQAYAVNELREVVAKFGGVK